MNDQVKLLFFSIFLAAASKTSATNFKKLQAFTLEMVLATNQKDEFADQVFAQSLSDLCNIIAAMR